MNSTLSPFVEALLMAWAIQMTAGGAMGVIAYGWYAFARVKQEWNRGAK